MSILVHEIKELDDMDVQCWDAPTLQLALVHVPLIISRMHRFVDAILSVTIRQCIMITFTRHLSNKTVHNRYIHVLQPDYHNVHGKIFRVHLNNAVE